MNFKLYIDRLVKVWQRDTVSVDAESLEEAIENVKVKVIGNSMEYDSDDIECESTDFVMETIEPVTDNNGDEIVEILDNDSTLWRSKATSVISPANKLFKHNKSGNYYYVICEGMHTETQEDFVVYAALYGDNKIYVRPKSMFYEDVVINGKTMKRFEPADEDQEGIRLLTDYYNKLEF